MHQHFSNPVLSSRVDDYDTLADGHLSQTHSLMSIDVTDTQRVMIRRRVHRPHYYYVPLFCLVTFPSSLVHPSYGFTSVTQHPALPACRSTWQVDKSVGGSLEVQIGSFYDLIIRKLVISHDIVSCLPSHHVLPRWNLDPGFDHPKFSCRWSLRRAREGIID